MSVPDHTRFMSECILHDPDQQSGLRDDDVYGLYLSWCFLNQEQPGPDHALRAAMKERGHIRRNRGSSSYIWPGLAMTGPAAVDYILSSQPSLV